VISKKRPSPSVEGDDDDQHRRARKLRSPLPLFDSDSTPEGTESSSDESNGPVLSQQSQLDTPPPEPIVKPQRQRLTIKLRGLRTTDPVDSPTSSRTSSPPPTKIAPLLHTSSHTATVSTVKTATPATS
jgi:OTU domain-containing protein 3